MNKVRIFAQVKDCGDAESYLGSLYTGETVQVLGRVADEPNVTYRVLFETGEEAECDENWLCFV